MLTDCQNSSLFIYYWKIFALFAIFFASNGKIGQEYIEEGFILFFLQKGKENMMIQKSSRWKAGSAAWTAASLAVLMTASCAAPVWADGTVSTAEAASAAETVTEGSNENTSSADQSDPAEQDSTVSLTFSANGGTYADGRTERTMTASGLGDRSDTVTYGQAGGDTIQDTPLLTIGDVSTDMTLQYVEMTWTDNAAAGAVTFRLPDESDAFFTSAGDGSVHTAVEPSIPLVTASGTDGSEGCTVQYHALYAAQSTGDLYEAPVRDGYVLTGWYTDPDASVQWDGTATVGTVYAGWAEDTASSVSSIPAVTSDPTVSSDSSNNESVTPVPTEEPVTPAPTETPVTPAPTETPVTPAPTEEPVTPVPTEEPVTPAPTQEPTSSTTSSVPSTSSTTSSVPTSTPEGPTVSYKVQHMLMDLDGQNYTLKDTETLSASAGSTVQPKVKNYSGFEAPSVQSAVVKEDGSTVITYRYARKTYQYTLNTTDHASFSGSTPSGTYYYGASVKLRCETDAGYTFVKWSNGDTSASASLTMPAGNTVISPVVQLTEYKITYDLDGGEADNPDSYTITSPAITLTAPTKKGARFLGWTGSNGTDPQASVTIPTGSTGDLSYKAVWSADSSVSSGSTSAASGASSTTSAAQTKNGTLGNVQTSDAGWSDEWKWGAMFFSALAVFAILNASKKRETEKINKKQKVSEV